MFRVGLQVEIPFSLTPSTHLSVLVSREGSKLPQAPHWPSSLGTQGGWAGRLHQEWLQGCECETGRTDSDHQGGCCPYLQINLLKPNPQCDGAWRWAVIGPRRQSSGERDQHLIKEAPESFPRCHVEAQQEDSCLCICRLSLALEIFYIFKWLFFFTVSLNITYTCSVTQSCLFAAPWM